MSKTIEDRAKELLFRAYGLQMKGKLVEAIESYKSSIDLHPTAEAHTFLGWAYSFSGNYRAAIIECKKAIELDSEFGNPYNDIGAYLIQMGKLDESIDYLNKAIEAPRYATPHFPHYNIGRVLERKGLWFEALHEYKSSLDLEPDYILARDSYYRLLALLN